MIAWQEAAAESKIHRGDPWYRGTRHDDPGDTGVGDRRSLDAAIGAADRWARAVWTGAIALALIHVAWPSTSSTDGIMRRPSRQPPGKRRARGWGWRGGIYVNYLFLLFWLADACWCGPLPQRTLTLAPAGDARLAAFLFMFVNGAIVFASGAGRFAGIASVTTVLLASPTRRRLRL